MPCNGKVPRASREANWLLGEFKGRQSSGSPEPNLLKAPPPQSTVPPQRKSFSYIAPTCHHPPAPSPAQRSFKPWRTRAALALIQAPVRGCVSSTCALARRRYRRDLALHRGPHAQQFGEEPQPQHALEARHALDPLRAGQGHRTAGRGAGVRWFETEPSPSPVCSPPRTRALPGWVDPP